MSGQVLILGTMVYEYKVLKEAVGKVLKIDYEGSIHTPSIEDDRNCMARVFNLILEVGKVNKVSFMQKEEYVYDYEQIKLINELTDVYIHLVKEENLMDFFNLNVPGVCSKYFPSWHGFLRQVVLHELKGDPIGAYVNLIRRFREEEAKQKASVASDYVSCSQNFAQILKKIINALSQTEIIKRIEKRIPGFKPGDRSIYREIFRPSIRPYFMYTKLVTAYPAGAEELAAYRVGEDTEVMILKHPKDIRPLYHMIPPEFKLTEAKYDLLTAAREIMAEHRPQKAEFMDIERTRETFLSVEKDLLDDLAKSKGVKLNYKEIEELAEILLRYTIGFGLIEVLLADPKIQDIVINAPVGVSPISIIHADFGECRTNITALPKEAESWATKLRLLSGRPFDEANPILDTNIVVPGGRARVAAIQQPLSPSGLAYALRRHRDRPWTFPLFIDAKMLSPLVAGFLSFIADGARTILIAGTRSSGKTSLLGALMVEIMRSNRVITVEDTLELPVKQLRDLGYDIQSFKTRSVITGAEAEVPAEQAIRTSLRMGDSALIVGEVRSVEAKALYEAMRVGALAKVVAGTIHGDSPYGVFDRVVNDLGVPKTSFKATDIILVANPVVSPSGLISQRRLVGITEVRKFWTDDPVKEKGFADLFTYNPKTDTIDPTDVLLEGESEIIKQIGGKVKEWAGNWDAIWENIQLRAKIKQAIVDAAKEHDDSELMEAEFVVKANDEFHKITELVTEDVGKADPDRIFSEWKHWLKRQIEERRDAEEGTD